MCCFDSLSTSRTLRWVLEFDEVQVPTLLMVLSVFGLEEESMHPSSLTLPPNNLVPTSLQMSPKSRIEQNFLGLLDLN